MGKWHGLRGGGRLVLSWAWPMVKCFDRYSTGAAAEGPLDCKPEPDACSCCNNCTVTGTVLMYAEVALGSTSGLTTYTCGWRC